MICDKCGNELSQGSKFCNHCGAKHEAADKSCPNPDCRRSGLPPEALFCPECGREIFADGANRMAALNFKVSRPEVINEQVRNSKAPVSDSVTQLSGNPLDKTKEDYDTVYYGRTKEGIENGDRILIGLLIICLVLGVSLGEILSSSVPFFVFIGIGFYFAVLIKAIMMQYSEFHLNSSFDLLKEQLLNTKSYGKQKYAMTDLGNDRFRISSLTIKVLFARSENGNIFLFGNQSQMMRFIRKNINPKAVFVLKDN